MWCVEVSKSFGTILSSNPVLQLLNKTGWEQFQWKYFLSAFFWNFLLCQDHWHGDVPPLLVQPCYVALGRALDLGLISRHKLRALSMGSSSQRLLVAGFIVVGFIEVDYRYVTNLVHATNHIIKDWSIRPGSDSGQARDLVRSWSLGYPSGKKYREWGTKKFQVVFRGGVRGAWGGWKLTFSRRDIQLKKTLPSEICTPTRLTVLEACFFIYYSWNNKITNYSFLSHWIIFPMGGNQKKNWL